MQKYIGIRKEDKNKWERRVPLVPEDVKELKNKFGIEVILEPFERRAFTEKEFTDAGASFSEKYFEAPLVMAVKEIPIESIHPERAYIFFSHVIKGQRYNMPMLRKLLEQKCTLIDYECIVDDKKRRLVFYGRYAGLAGMIDTLSGLGKRLLVKGIETPFMHINPAYMYSDLDEAKSAVEKLAQEIKEFGLPADLTPLIIGFAGYGNVSKGAWEIFDILPHEVVQPDDLYKLKSDEGKKIYKVVFEEKHLVEPIDGSQHFEIGDYFNYPEKYKSKFTNYLPALSVLVNAIYWNEKYPRLITKEYLKEHHHEIKLIIVGDISCDINGSIEFTEKSTEADNPSFIYNPVDGSHADGFEGEGIANIAIDNLPAELPRDASIGFSKSLMPFIPGILDADFEKSFDEVNLPEEIKRAVIVYRGELTPDYKYLEKYLA
ncbi:MAG: bifunctional lysine ketoglutarate reductase /saccharopine dehydrogenase family protein [bacterium]